MPTSGFRELDAQLASLADAVGPKRADRVLRNSLRFAMTPSRKAAAAKAPIGTQMHKTYKGRLVAPGFLKRNVRVAVTRMKNGKATALLGPTKEAFYGTAFLERGVPAGTRKTKSGAVYFHPGVQATPWLVPAFEATKEIALKRFGDKLAENIEKERKK